MELAAGRRLQVPKAFVVKKDASLTEAELQEYVKKTLARHKCAAGQGRSRRFVSRGAPRFA